MHIAQEDIDYINNKYTFISEEAVSVLMLRQFYKYLYNEIRPPPLYKRVYTEEAKTDIEFILENNPNFNVEETLIRLKCQFESLFKNTFPRFF